MVQAQRIWVGAWCFFPEFMSARNMHNGTWASFEHTPGGWRIVCINCPAGWMLTEIGEWFQAWITGGSLVTARNQ